MSRPERRNAMSPAMLAALGSTLAAVAVDGWTSSTPSSRPPS
jgi:enoyl-CoA hydratase/carnithine racemase